ncbi:MAG TPA: winged helix-turn-helix domain-containing protein [Solirubrobacterales bacterium]
MPTTRKQKTRQVPESQLELHKALSHQLRVEILTYLTERTKASPVEMSRELLAPVGDISHHVKQLVKYGCAEAVETRPRRGAVEHFYRATSRPVIDVEEMERMTLPARRAFNGQVVQKVMGDLQQGFEAGTIEDNPDHHMTRIPLSLDAQGWNELVDLHRQTFEETDEIQTRSNERLAKSGEEPIRTSSSQLCFPLPPE